jgi:hypothetical protein
LLAGGYSARDRGADRAPFIVEQASPLKGLRDSGALGVVIRWKKGEGPEPTAGLSVAALCASYPGRSPVIVEWTDGDGVTVNLKARRLQVELADDFLAALRNLVGADAVALVKAR